MQHTGDPILAAELISEILALLESQLAIGVVISNRALHLQDYVGKLHALNGDIEKAMTALHHAAAQGGLTCVPCLRKQPFYDNLRDEAQFVTLVVEQKAKIAAQRQRLADEGLLLTPAEVLQLESFNYDPFLKE